MEPVSTPAPFNPGPVDVPDLTTALVQSSKRLAGKGSFAAVYRCSCAQNGEVAVKAISFDRSIDQARRDEFLRKVRRELGLWKRLDHPNIVPLLGTALGADFGSDHPCMVSMWMPHGTLVDYVSKSDNVLSLPDRIRLITGSAAGLEYLHSKSVLHGDFHPWNILIDNDHNPRLTDFGLSQTLSPQTSLTYLHTNSVPRGARMWVAPELLHPDLFPTEDESNKESSLNVDIYSLGSIILLILCGKSPWNSAEFENKLDEFQNPPRPLWPVIPDTVWDFIERCWSPRAPEKRPLAQEVLSFARNGLQQFLQPNPDAAINVVLFGAHGCGKSSIIDLLAEELIAPVSTNMEPCTEQSRCYQIHIGERKFHLWDTTEFHLARGDISHLSPYEQAHAVLRNLPDGVHLILLCARKDEIPSLGSLFWLINDFFFGGRAPVAFVVTHFDDFNQRLWDRNQRSIAKMTGIPIQSILHAFRTTALTGDDDDQKLKALLANAVSSIPLPLDHSSHAAAARDIATRCKLSDSDAADLVERFNRSCNVVENGREESR
ncbi:kinase-like domain-containing protein [Butyriboletus roseoflavus]|nr:kinase-like domain-containing protein [Butyriboletus roseoflavus]